MRTADPNSIIESVQERHIGFTITRAQNGFVFKLYDIATDSMKLIVAKDVDELGAIIEDWAAITIREMKKVLSRPSHD